ncbi:hypothetical protein LWI29_023473 [Acer saccharum]|uniref:CBS domain-containing protein n=1 Tax=Acer saccharum TaxID=4024 RepID=A0AA39RUY2_ACESA|nr:hypothetical protein LWI29_023473 [Acer saccharum]
MAARLLGHEVSELCIGKPALRSLSVSAATVADALSALKRSDERHVSVWSCQHSWRKAKAAAAAAAAAATNGGEINVEDSCKCVGKVCMVDIICFLSKEENLSNPGIALQSPVSVLISKGSGFVKHLEPNASLSEAIDLILEGAQNLVIPLRTREKFIHKPLSSSTIHNNREYCWLTQEDILRYLFNHIGLIGPAPNHPIESLNMIDKDNFFMVQYDDPAASALAGVIAKSLAKQTSVAVVDEEGKVMGEISPSTLNSCDESVAPAIATLSIGDLMAYIDYGGPPEELLRLVRKRLEERNMEASLELMDDESGFSSSSSANGSSSDEESSVGSGRSGKFGRYSTRVVRWSEGTVCHPWSSLVAVMIQALSRRVSYVWVVDEDGSLTGIVTSTGVLRVFRERLSYMVKAETDHNSNL